LALFGDSAKTEKALQRTRNGWFGKIARLFERIKVDDSLWEELEALLISADVGVVTTNKLIERAQARSKEAGLSDATRVRAVLREEMVRILKADRERYLNSRLPLTLTIVGVNGSGKTTSIAKMANYFKGKGKSVLLAAGDTFRAAASDQLRLWGKKVGVDVIYHRPGGDPGAVAFDALRASESRNIDVLIIDTAGRLHTKYNLMEELKKVKRVLERAHDREQRTVLVLDATTGQNGLAQARHFMEAVDVGGVFLSKLDGTARGGVVLPICDQLGLPVLFVGTGEDLDDLAPFEAEVFVDALLR
jgi:fused signal recognition particle receptor